ncbi:MAG: hypothetical protein MJB12_00645, partial [Firmicutes bacterium]|nr:hypothetical protein [Bacillota bacterium]
MFNIVSNKCTACYADMTERVMGVNETKQSGRMRESFDFNWKFHLGDIEGGESVALNDDAWRNLHLPHDYSIEGSY